MRIGGKFRPADKKRFRRWTMERRHRNARRGPTDSRRIGSVVGLRIAFEDRNPDSAASIRTKPSRIGTTDRSADLLVGRGPQQKIHPTGRQNKQAGAGRNERTCSGKNGGSSRLRTGRCVRTAADSSHFRPTSSAEASGNGRRDPSSCIRNRRRADRDVGRQPGFGSLPTARTLRPSMPSKAGRP